MPPLSATCLLLAASSAAAGHSGKSAKSARSSAFLKADNITEGCTLTPAERELNITELRGRSNFYFFTHGGNRMRLFYQPADRWLPSNGTVVDVGSFVGDDLVALMKRGVPTKVQIHTFEPVQETRERLERRIQKYRGQIIAHPFGLGSRNTTACFMGSGKSAWVAEGKSCDAPSTIVDARHAFRELGVVIDFLQINCEGCELPIVMRLTEDEALSSYVKRIEMQVHGQKNVSMADYCAMEERLRARGFRIEYRLPFVWERWVVAERAAR